MDAPSNFNQQLELFFGDCSDALGRVYARLRGGPSAADVQLSGSLTGPSCAYSETLPARFQFVDRGPGSSLLAEAVVPEPCFWTPQMPQLYQASVQLRRGPEVLARADRMFGFRALGMAGGKLFYHGKRWVLRGFGRDELGSTHLADWHASDSAMLARNPDDALCAQASRLGVLIVAELDEPSEHEIHRLAQWPAVAVVALPGNAALDLHGLAHNLLLAAQLDSRQPLIAPPWAQIVLYDASVDQAPLDQLCASSSSCAVIATRASSKPFASIAQARAACDGLQRDLAPRDLAGYIV